MSSVRHAGWLGSLSHEDLRRLRVVVRRVHMSNYPMELMTDREADRIIESFGPDVAMKRLKVGIDEGLLSGN